METTALKVEKREKKSPGYLNSLRSQDIVPAVYYGKTQETVLLSVPGTDLRAVMAAKKANTVLDLEIDGQSGSLAMIYDVHKDIISGEVLHLDFIEVKEDRPVKATVPVKLTGVASGVKNEGGFLFQPTKKITVEALPANLPAEYVVDVTEFAAKHTEYVTNIELGEGVKLASSNRAVIVTISKGRKK